MGLCRTYVFVRQSGEQGVPEALRQHHTVVYDSAGAAYGDASPIALTAQYGGLRRREPAAPGNGVLDWVSRTCGVAGMLGPIVTGFRGVYSKLP
jgi:hypothetical protein